MTKLVEEEKEKSWFQILAILSSSLTAVSCGILFSWCSPSIPKIISDKENYDISLEEASYFTVIPPLACICSCFIFSALLDVIGRKYLVLFMAIPHATALIIVCVADSVYVFYASRVVAGIGDACLFAALPVYIGEIATPKVRGTWGNAMSLGIYFGQFLINVIGGYFNIKHAAYVCLSVPILFTCSFVFMPESPYYLIMKGRYDEARIVLRKLRRVKNVETELDTLKIDVSRQLSESGTWKDLFTIRSNRKALFALTFLRTSQQFAGISSFQVYTQYIFEKSGQNISALTAAIIFSGLVFLLCFFAGMTIDRFGKKKSYMCSLMCCGIILFLEAIYFYIDLKVTSLSLSKFYWFPVAGMIIYVIVFSYGAGVVPTLMLGELFSSSIKAKGLCALNIVFAFEVSTITKLFQILETNFGMFSPFLLFAICSISSVFLSIFFIPDTKGKTLEQIQQELKGTQKDNSK